MPGFYRITFQPSGKSIEFAGTRGEKYLFPDGTEVDVQASPVWCLQCGKVTHGEDVETLEQLGRQIANFEDPNSQHSRMFHQSRDLQLQKLRERRKWRTQRQSPPKCLDCGSTQIVDLSSDPVPYPSGQETLECAFGPVPHPAGQGTIECAFIGMCSTEFTNRPYTPEGDRILGPIRPSYWHLPGTPDPALERARMTAHADLLRLRSGVPADRDEEQADPEPVDPAVIDAIHKELGVP